MSKRLPFSLPTVGEDRPPIWRTLDQKREPELAAREATEEKGVQASKLVQTDSIVSRRRFMQVGGATAAAVGLSGCLRRPAEQILPYSQAPEYSLPGMPLHFATSVNHDGQAFGLLVESHEGRPTKIEGNPEHPASGGATDARLQASILDLYDPDRPGKLMRGAPDARDVATWAEFDAWWREKAAELGGGEGLRVLVPPTDSPSFMRARAAFMQRFPQARVHTWSALSGASSRAGTLAAFGQPLDARVDYARAKVVLSVDCDFLGDEPGAVRNQRHFAEGRRITSPNDEMNRLYVVEGTLSVTGMNADHRLRLAPSQADRYLRALAAKLASEGATLPGGAGEAVRGVTVEGVPVEWVNAVAADLMANRGSSAVTVGWRQPPHVHALAHAINAGLGNLGTTVQLFPAVDAEEPDANQSLGDLVTAMGAGDVDTLFVFGGNPVYDAPGFADAIGNVETVVRLGGYDDETSRASGWFLPMAHPLESWGDHRSSDGTVSIQQPLIAPLRGGRADLEMMAFLAGIRAWRGYHLVRNTLREQVGAASLDRTWRAALHRGVVPGLPAVAPATGGLTGDVAGALRENEPAAPQGWEAVFTPSYQTGDGQYANNAWMLELPDPVTKIVWDNAAYVSPESARQLGVETGDMLNISREGAGDLSIPAFVLPGHADQVVTLPLGFGRTAAGRHGNGVGFDVNPLRAGDGFARVTVSKGSGEHQIVQTQDHHSMEGRPLVIDASLEEYRETPNFAQWREPTPSTSPLWTQVDYAEPLYPAQGGKSYSLVPEALPPREGAPPRYKWAMAMDLTTCTGCSACIIACQAENNIPIVGKMQVAMGREMHWMRLDRYFVGDDEAQPKVAIQPVACQHCEEAPCENVCPVAATVHTPEGLNVMAYNRCIGTRYCMNNCPYKVRRFNFLDWHGEVPELKKMQHNPNVTVRMRGVIEKCSYCVQRIQTARIHARTQTTVDAEGEIDERRIQDGEVTPACAQACPSQALIFGDLNDTESRVHRWVHMDRQYKLLASIGAQPRTTYVGKIRNPNPEMV
ncbi:MAG: 4Fe-4S dicluster domain-containing protein [Sandaracinaceae bacterium]|nr:MAG: 4Fe-4S dicluster domain-containing protein [Sandaracinaceae bacterium]